MRRTYQSIPTRHVRAQRQYLKHSTDWINVISISLVAGVLLFFCFRAAPILEETRSDVQMNVLESCFERNSKRVAALNQRYEHLKFELGKFANFCPEKSSEPVVRGKGKLPQDVGIAAEWFDQERHFFSKERLLQSGKFDLFRNFMPQIPDSFDWSDYIKYPIKDQGHFSSCWTFSSTETAEMAAWMAGHDDMPRISEQHLLDCFETKQAESGDWCRLGSEECGYVGWNKGDGGSGGYAEDAMQYWSLHGFQNARAYPYIYGICKGRQELPPGVNITRENLKLNCESSDFCMWNEKAFSTVKRDDFFVHLATQFCENVSPKIHQCRTDLEPLGKISGIVLVSYDPASGAFKSPGMNEEAMKEALVRLGPLSVQMNAIPFMRYKTGIVDFDASECDQTDLDHVLQLIGYGTENGVDYWKVRNSWGPFWGETGHVRIKRGGNVCGIAANVFAAYM